MSKKTTKKGNIQSDLPKNNTPVQNGAILKTKNFESKSQQRLSPNTQEVFDKVISGNVLPITKKISISPPKRKFGVNVTYAHIMGMSIPILQLNLEWESGPKIEWEGKDNNS